MTFQKCQDCEYDTISGVNWVMGKWRCLVCVEKLGGGPPYRKTALEALDSLTDTQIVALCHLGGLAIENKSRRLLIDVLIGKIEDL